MEKNYMMYQYIHYNLNFRKKYISEMPEAWGLE